MDTRMIKPISFNSENETDAKILNYLEENEVKFSPYVKRLILRDMARDDKINQTYETVEEIKSILTNFMGNGVKVVFAPSAEKEEK